MLDLAELRPGMRVLDLASGRGEPSLRAARRVGTGGSVLGVDVSDSVLEIAREKARAEGITNIEYRVADVEALVAGEHSFDVVTERWGLMYMRSPVSALENARRALRSGGRFVGAYWAEPERVSWATLPQRALGRHRPPPHAGGPGAFRYADPASIVRDFALAGLTIDRIEEIDVPVIEAETGAGIAEWARDLGFARRAGDLSERELASWEADLARDAEQFRVGTTIRLSGVTRLVLARAAS